MTPPTASVVVGLARCLIYWITSSAVANSVSGMVRPSALAVLRLMTMSAAGAKKKGTDFAGPSSLSDWGLI